MLILGGQIGAKSTALSVSGYLNVEKHPMQVIAGGFTEMSGSQRFCLIRNHKEKVGHAESSVFFVSGSVLFSRCSGR
jgi:hypothetical protein